MKKKLILITDYKNNFYCHHKNHTMNINYLKKLFSSNYKEVDIMTFEEVKQNINNIKNNDIIYTSIENNKEYKGMIKDIIYLLSKNNNIYPKYEILLMHDNKAFQEYYKNYLDISSLKAYTFTNYLEFLDTKNIEYPIVFKNADGSGSTNVKLAYKKSDIFKYLKSDFITNIKINRKNRSFTYKLKSQIIVLLMKLGNEKIFLNKCITMNLNDTNFILQEYKKNSTHDFKVLVYYDKIFALKRLVRDNDFRASGSGKFLTGKLEQSTIDYVYALYKKIDTPIASFDIIETDKKPTLIEYQGIHHGPATICLTDIYYELKNNKWTEKENEYKNTKYNVEDMFYHAYINYIEEQND